jgi:hypothetical protein
MMAYDFEVEGIRYNFLMSDVGSVGVAGCNNMTDITIPSQVYYAGGWLVVKEICSGAFYCSSVRTVSFPNTLEVIRSYAFCDSYITSVSLPSSLRIIEDCAFADTKIREVRIPASVEKIGYEAFGGHWDDSGPDAEYASWVSYPEKYIVESGSPHSDLDYQRPSLTLPRYYKQPNPTYVRQY